FPKPQSEGFYVVLADTGKNEIIALKRVGWPSSEKVRGGRPTAKAVLKVPQSAVARKVDVLVVSDAYVGMVWRVEGPVEVPGAPEVGDEGKK
ncbi:MAG: hypothetical protein M1830_006631, partial [Pleopsidium flavum]